MEEEKHTFRYFRIRAGTTGGTSCRRSPSNDYLFKALPG